MYSSFGFWEDAGIYKSSDYTIYFCSPQKGALGLDGQGDVSPLDKHLDAMTELGGKRGEAPVAPWMFALAGQQHSRQLASCDL